jgi:hypothetical protein
MFNTKNSKAMENTIKKNDSFVIPSGFSAKQTAKLVSANFGVNASDFVQFGNKIVYQPKKKSSNSKRPKGMTDEEYYRSLNLAKISQDVKSVKTEEWRPIQNMGRYFGGEVNYGLRYEVSNKGRLKTIEGETFTISEGYDAPTRKAMQFHLNSNVGGKTLNTCPDVKYMVADAFLGTKDTKKYIVIHIDGDYHNNEVTNLMWVQR